MCDFGGGSERDRGEVFGFVVCPGVRAFAEVCGEDVGTGVGLEEEGCSGLGGEVGEVDMDWIKIELWSRYDGVYNGEGLTILSAGV